MRIAIVPFIGAISILSSIVPVQPVQAAGDSPIGVTTAATLVVRGTPVGSESRVLEVGTDLRANERVDTSETGRAHLLFKDGSTLSVGPNSELVLDSYIYDPEKNSGKIAFSTAKGVFRFVGGRISKNTVVEFKAPTATLGIRGGIAMFSVGQTVKAAHIYGLQTSVKPDGGNLVTFNRPDYIATVNHGAVTVGPMTSNDFRFFNRSLAGVRGLPVVGLPAAGGAPSNGGKIPAVNADYTPPPLPVAAQKSVVQNLQKWVQPSGLGGASVLHGKQPPGRGIPPGLRRDPNIIPAGAGVSGGAGFSSGAVFEWVKPTPVSPMKAE